LHNTGNTSEALRIMHEFVEGKTHEPLSIYKMGVIYLASGNSTEGRRFLHQAQQSSFELGPATAMKIEYALKGE